jgi:hypothetical protein
MTSTFPPSDTPSDDLDIRSRRAMKRHDLKGKDHTLKEEGSRSPRPNDHHAVGGISIAAENQPLHVKGGAGLDGWRGRVHGGDTGGLIHQDRA